MLSLLLISHALAAPVLEVPVDGPRDAARTVRRLADLGYPATVVKPAGALRVRIDPQPAERLGAAQLAERVAAELGRGVLTFDDGGGELPPAIATTLGEDLDERLLSDERVLFRFARELPNGRVTHLWAREGQRVAVSVSVDEGDLRPSRLLLEGDRAWIWTDGGRGDASVERVRGWTAQLSPSDVLEPAFMAGFGGAVQPAEGCREIADGWLCVGQEQVAPEDGVRFYDLVRTSEGQWLPGVIERFSAGELQDRVLLISLAFPDQLPGSWFDADFPGIMLSP